MCAYLNFPLLPNHVKNLVVDPEAGIRKDGSQSCGGKRVAWSQDAGAVRGGEGRGGDEKGLRVTFLGCMRFVSCNDLQLRSKCVYKWLRSRSRGGVMISKLTQVKGLTTRDSGPWNFPLSIQCIILYIFGPILSWDLWCLKNTIQTTSRKVSAFACAVVLH